MNKLVTSVVALGALGCTTCSEPKDSSAITVTENETVGHITVLPDSLEPLLNKTLQGLQPLNIDGKQYPSVSCLFRVESAIDQRGWEKWTVLREVSWIRNNKEIILFVRTSLKDDFGEEKILNRYAFYPGEEPNLVLSSHRTVESFVQEMLLGIIKNCTFTYKS